MSRELSVALKIVGEVNKLLLKKFRHLGQVGVHHKKHGEIVTDADWLANDFITRELLKKFPRHDIVSEEAKKIDNPDTFTWHVDPLDGTTNFAYGFPEFATCLGWENKGEILLGVIGLPVEEEIYYAEKNRGAFRGRKKLRVSAVSDLKKSLLLLCRGHVPAGRRRFHRFFSRLIKQNVGHFRQFSCAGIELSAVASGKADGCVMSDIHPWDVLPGVILIREAGGRVSNWQGQEWRIVDNNLVASNGLIHKEIIKLTKGIK